MSDSTSGTPAPYLRVAAALHKRVTDGTWAPGFRLPSRGTLGREFGVGENVVRRAQELLITRGVLEGRAGSGTYVRLPSKRRPMLRTSLADAESAPRAPGPAPQGFQGTWEAESTAKVPAPASVATRLGIHPGDLCVRTDYEFLTSREPVMLATSWEPMALTGRTLVVLPEGGPLAHRGVVARMAHLGITVNRICETPRPVQVDRAQAQLLGIATGSPATVIERTHYATDGTAVETADILVPAEKWEITYEFPSGAPTPRPDVHGDGHGDGHGQGDGDGPGRRSTAGAREERPGRRRPDEDRGLRSPRP